MPLPTSHGFLGAAIVAAIHPKINRVFTIPLFLGGFLANVADIDFVLYLPGDLGFNLLADYQWHRGFTHSFLFSILVFLAIALYLGRDQLQASAAYGIAYFSHILLDYFTSTRGGGLELFWFLSDKRYQFGLIGLSEEPLRMSILEIIQALGFEALLFGLLFAFVYYARKIFYQVRH